MAMRGFTMGMGFAGAGFVAMALAGGCSSSSGAKADAGSEGGIIIHRLDSGESDGDDGSTGIYTGPAVTSCTMSALGLPPPSSDDGGAEAGVVGEAGEPGEAGADGGVSGDAGAAPAPGTTGKTCTSDADCKGNQCNLNDPTPVCFVPVDPATGTNCDPGTDGRIHFCDGPDVDTSPGVCLPLTNPPTAGQGLCIQACLFKTDGSAAQGCTGNDACNSSGLYLSTSTGGVLGLGWCGLAGGLFGIGNGGCMTDTDCHGPNTTCAPDFGFCTNLTISPNPAPCECIPGQSGSGVCAKACVVGSATKCPTGTVCDALEPTMLVDQTNTPVPAFTKPNAGLAGFCFASCTNGACPSSTTCVTSNAAGPDCEPQ
jgi:hypothetical protein